MFNGVISTPSRYQLPSFISADKLIEELRGTLAKTLIFIHTWADENQSNEFKDILNAKYDTYIDFFTHVLSFIMLKETNLQITEIAHDLQHSLKPLYQYLGSYHGNLRYTVYNIQDFISVLLIIIYLMQLISRYEKLTNIIIS
jgi:hypothetical protein